MKIRGKLAGAAGLKAVLAAAGPKAFREGARKGVTAAAQVVSKDAKAKVPTRTKSLKKAIGHKVKANREKTGYVGVIGPRKDVKGAVVGGAGKRRAKFRRKVKHKGRELIVDPVKYAHLVEGGRKAVKRKESAGNKAKRLFGKLTKALGLGGNSARRPVLSDGQTVFGPKAKAVPPRPFMRPAWEENKARCAALIRQKLAEAAAKLKAKG